MFDHFGDGGALPGHTGNAIAVSGDGTTIAVGAPHEGSAATGIGGNQDDDSTYNAGAVYVYARAGDGWAQQAYVKASNAGSGDHFGGTVVLSEDGNTMAVAANWEASAATGVNGNQDDNSRPQSGAVYVFTRGGATWTQQAYLKASNTGGEEDGDQFGFSLALSDDGNTLAVGAISEDSSATGVNSDQADNSLTSAGAVYLFGRTGTAWAQQAYVKAPNTFQGALFGFSVSLNADGSTLAVGSYDERGCSRVINGPYEPNNCNGMGAAYVFARAGDAWSQEAYLKPSNGENGDSFGVSIALSDDGSTVLVGVIDSDCRCTGIVHGPTEVGLGDQPDNISTGSAFVFVRDGTTWTQQAYIQASNTGVEDGFGIRLALSGDGNTAAIGASHEGSAAQGINGQQGDDSATEAGAAYYFTRSNGTWSQHAYVKGENTEAFDAFGTSVALSRDGRVMVVGAMGEDSAASGNPADNSIDESGAVYVFTR
jgi:hypothetical protein